MGVILEEVVNILKQICFKGQVSDVQMVVLLIVVDQYKFNLFIKELYVFFDKNNGIVLVVGVDGWVWIINENLQFDGMEFLMDQQGIECICKIYWKDCSYVISVIEYMVECKWNIQFWQFYLCWMFCYKVMIQCVCFVFGFVGIYDQDEVEWIVE